MDQPVTGDHRSRTERVSAVVLLDLDGVVRHFDPDHRINVERTYGLEAGALEAAAFAPALGHLVVTGRMTFDQWVSRVGEVVGSPTAARQWLHEAGSIDWDLVAVVDELRASDIVVAVLTNGTDTVGKELDDLGVTSHFDAIFNSAEIGFAKPDRRAFEYVCNELEVAGPSVLFTDDTAAKLAGAVELGMTARLYEGLATFQTHLEEFLVV